MATRKSTRHQAGSSPVLSGTPLTEVPKPLDRYLSDMQITAYRLQGLLQLLDKAIDTDGGVLAIAINLARDLNVGLDSVTLGRALQGEVLHGRA